MGSINLFDIRDRLILLIKVSGLTPTQLEAATGVAKMSWSNIKRKSCRANQDHIEGAVKLWPEYSYWLTTGETLPQAGQISPEIEEVRKNLYKGGEAT